MAAAAVVVVDHLRVSPSTPSLALVHPFRLRDGMHGQGAAVRAVLAGQPPAGHVVLDSDDDQAGPARQLPGERPGLDRRPGGAGGAGLGGEPVSARGLAPPVGPRQAQQTPGPGVVVFGLGVRGLLLLI